MDILENTIKKITPSQEEISELNNLFQEIKKYIKSKYNINAELMGSVAKNTFLKNNNDLDIFIFFDKSTPPEDLEKKALKIGKDTFEHFDGSWQIDYASHPYTKGKIRNYKVEVVPCYKIKTIKEMISAVDRTPFHTKYITKNLEPARRKDVLLLKQFLKTINCYGSDLKTKGFAGYLCELLIIKYKTFEGVLKEFSDLKRNTIISLSNSSNNTKKIIEKFDAPFIFLDPVDKNRNVAASLSIDVLLRTKYYSQQYLQNPDEIYFNPIKFEKKTSSKKSLKTLLENRNFYVLCFKKPDLIEDILYPQLERFKNSLKKYVLSKEFQLNDCFFDCCLKTNLCIIGFDFSTNNLSCFIHRRGPDIFAQKEKTEGFLNKHKNVYLSDGNYMCFEKRKITNACDLINSVKKKEAQKQIAIPKEIEKNLNKSFCVLDNKKIEEYVKSNKISSNVIYRNIAGGKTI